MSEEEIDIGELLKRVKEGKAPKRILINGLEYCYEDETTFGDYYRDTEKYGKVFFSNEYDFRTLSKIANIRIKILDEHKIEKLEEKIHGLSLGDTNRTLLYVIKKINEIIEKINGEGK